MGRALLPNPLLLWLAPSTLVMQWHSHRGANEAQPPDGGRDCGITAQKLDGIQIK